MVHEADRGHNHRTGVHARLPDDAFQAPSRVINLFHIRVGFHHLANLGGLRIALVIRVRDAPKRNILGHDRRWQRRVDAVGHLEARLAKVHLGGVFNGLLRLHRAEGNHLRHLVLAPALGRVGDHFAAAAVIEVDIDIGGGRALGIQESLEEEIMFQGVDIGNGQRVSDKRAGRRTTAWPHTNAHRARVLDELGHDKEVGRVSLHLNNGNLILRALDVLLRNILTGEASLQALHNLVGEPGSWGVALGDVGNRHAIVGVFFPNLAIVLYTLGNPQRVIAAIWNHIVPGLAHLRGRFNVVAGAAELEAIRVHKGLAGLHAQHRLVRRRLGFQNVVAVVGHQRRQVQLAADL